MIFLNAKARLLLYLRSYFLGEYLVIAGGTSKNWECSLKFNNYTYYMTFQLLSKKEFTDRDTDIVKTKTCLTLTKIGDFCPVMDLNFVSSANSGVTSKLP